MERHVDEMLRQLNQDIIRMGIMAQEEIRDSVESLKARNKEAAQAVIDRDCAIDELELQIDEHCIDLIARYQPMAKDLRFITTGMKLNAELERIADLAVDIAERVLELVDKPLLKPLIDIPKLSVVAQTMVGDAINAFVNRDVDLAKRVVLSDSEADRLRDVIQDELMNDFILKDASCAPRAMSLLLVARHLERICDHATNIAEDVIYMVNAEVVRHHPEKLG